MTCIVGLKDSKTGVLWLGGDSLGSNSYSKSVESQPKIFQNNRLLMGGTTSFRHLDLLRYMDLDIPLKIDIDHKYMVKNFIPKIIELFRTGIVDEDEKERGGSFLVAASGHLFKIQRDYSVLESVSGLAAVGSGSEVAMGSLITTETLDMSPEKRITLALKAAENYSRGVARPFHIMNTIGNTIEIR